MDPPVDVLPEALGYVPSFKREFSNLATVSILHAIFELIANTY
jgi:hypothetical protein